MRTNVVVTFLCVALALITLGAVGESGRKRAKEAVCQANLHQWHGIFQGYLEQNDGKFFTGDKGTPGYWWPKELSEEHRDWKRTRIWFCPTANVPLQNEGGQIVRTLNIFTAWGIFTGADLGPNGISGSYALNGYALDIRENWPESHSKALPRRTFESGVPATDGWLDLNNVPEANTVPVFLDALRFDLWPLPIDCPVGDEFAAWTGNMMARACINRHDGAVNCLFVDGSVRRVGLKELWTLKWHKSFNTAGPWTKAGGATPWDWPQWMRPFQDY